MDIYVGLHVFVQTPRLIKDASIQTNCCWMTRLTVVKGRDERNTLTQCIVFRVGSLVLVMCNTVVEYIAIRQYNICAFLETNIVSYRVGASVSHSLLESRKISHFFDVLRNTTIPHALMPICLALKLSKKKNNVDATVKVVVDCYTGSLAFPKGLL